MLTPIPNGVNTSFRFYAETNSRPIHEAETQPATEIPTAQRREGTLHRMPISTHRRFEPMRPAPESATRAAAQTAREQAPEQERAQLSSLNFSRSTVHSGQADMLTKPPSERRRTHLVANSKWAIYWTGRKLNLCQEHYISRSTMCVGILRKPDRNLPRSSSGSQRHRHRCRCLKVLLPNCTSRNRNGMSYKAGLLPGSRPVTALILVAIPIVNPARALKIGGAGFSSERWPQSWSCSST